MREATVSALYVYPVKGCGGGAVDALDITEQGIVGDREYAFIGEDGLLVEQKKTPILASIAAELTESGLVFQHAISGSFEHAHRAEGHKVPGTWIIDKFEGIDQGDEVAAWASNIIDKKVRLICVGESWTINFPVPDMARLHGKSKRRFTAASEISITNLVSLAALNKDLDVPIGMDRFRSNIVVDGIEAYAEDEMEIISNGQVEIMQVTPAERCEIITTDQKTGERPANNILKVLAKTRRKVENRFGTGLLFGNYMTVNKPGSLSVGDKLSFLPYDDA